MEKGDSIKIKSDLQKEVSTNITIRGKKYLILTEDIEPKENMITTQVYLGGKILHTRKTDCKTILKAPARQEKIVEFIYRQHEIIVEMLKKGKNTETKNPSYYLDEVKTLLQRKNNRDALNLLTDALDQFPSDPFLLSYYGCLEAIINKNYKFGIDTCSRAIEILNKRIPFGQEIFYPTFYLNLGRAYVAAKNRKGAVDAFEQGIAFDKENRDLIWEMKKLGLRKSALIPFLQRSNPINKYIGMLLYMLKKSPW